LICGDPDWIRTNNLPLRRGVDLIAFIDPNQRLK